MFRRWTHRVLVVAALVCGGSIEIVVTVVLFVIAGRTHNTFTNFDFDKRPLFETAGVGYRFEVLSAELTRTQVYLGWPMYWCTASGVFEPACPKPGTIQFRPNWAYPYAAAHLLGRGGDIIWTGAVVNAALLGLTPVMLWAVGRSVRRRFSI